MLGSDSGPGLAPWERRSDRGLSSGAAVPCGPGGTLLLRKVLVGPVESPHGCCMGLIYRKEPTDIVLKGFINSFIHSLIYSLAVYSEPTVYVCQGCWGRLCW